MILQIPLPLRDDGSNSDLWKVFFRNVKSSLPSILLADEPTGALDQKSGTEVLKLFTKLNEMGNTIVMITHDLNVAQWAKRTVRIIDGEMFEESVEPTE